jgi:ABC-type uncharacterized transport system ATPase subunit
MTAGTSISSLTWLDGIIRRADYILRVPLSSRNGISYTPLIDWCINIITSVATPNDAALLLMALITEHVLQNIITHGVAMAFNQPHDYIKIVLLERVIVSSMAHKNTSSQIIGRTRLTSVLRMIHDVIAAYELPSSLRAWATSRNITTYAHMFVAGKASNDELMTLLASITVP